MALSSSPARHITLPLALAGTALGCGVALLAWWGHGGGTDGIAMAARYTARLSFALFLVVFLARPLSASAPWLIRERRGLGLAFAGAHFVHLAALVAAVMAFDGPPALLTVVFGGFGYVLLTAMVLTSNDAAVRTLGPRVWRRLHTFGLYYLWFIFTVTYLRRVMGRPDMVEYWILLMIAAVALAWRIWARRSSRPQAAAIA